MTPGLRCLRIFKAIRDEFMRAEQMFPPFNSAHEGYAVLLEEVDEVKDLVFVNPLKRADWGATADARLHEHRRLLRAEAVQVAAMAMRFISMLDTKDRATKC